jgi:signal transduction histidine kinase
MNPERRFMARLQWVFFILLLLMVAVMTTIVSATQPALIATPRGVAIAVLVVAYVGWDWRWRFSYLVRLNWRWGLVAWVGNLALSFALCRLDPTYVTLLWILLGVTLFYLESPLVKTFGIAVVVAMLALSGAVNTRLQMPRSLTDWAGFLLWILVVGTWLAVGVMLNHLFETRARNARLIEELRASQEQLRRAAVQERELATLRERERLARDLHDVVGHALVLVTVKLEAAQRLGRVDQARAETELRTTRELVRETMNELRRAVASLRAAPLDRQSLATAISEQARETGDQAGLQVRIHCAEIGGLSAAQEDALWRVTQEALTNVVKHAGATELAVSLARNDGLVTVEVRDNGRGLVPVAHGGAEKPGHYGIRGMHERLELLGGRLTVAAAPEGGTRVRAELPVGGEGDDDGR